MDLELNRGVSPTLKIFQNVIWWFIVLINLGYIMVWLMMPTNTFFMHWLPEIQAKADPIYFGKQGTTILVYTFPIIFIATLACLYHHLMQKASNHSTESKIGFLRKASWRKPLFVNGPLGIISKTEFSFIIMFVILLIWSLCSYLHGMFSKVALQAAYEREQVWEAKLKNSALALGFVGNICLAFLFFPVSRGSSILRFTGLTSEASIKYHIWLGHIAMTMFTAHGLGYVTFWEKTHHTAEIFKWNKVGISNVAGVVALLAGLTMWTTTLPLIRRKFFEIFFYTHHLFLQSQQKIQLVSARVLPCEAVELNFSKNPGLCYAPTSIIFINIASISKLQWHPFSITSCSTTDSDTLSILIKSTGKWSHTLFQKLSTLSPPAHLDVSIEGPYGPASTFFSRHETLVMVSGGSGITPFISIIRSLLFKANIEGGKSPKVLLICSFKKSIDLTMIDLILPVSGTALDTSRLQLQIEAYVTREKQPATTNDRKLLQTLWSILSMFFVCVSIVIAATSVFLWNKKQNKALRQIKNTSTPTTSPRSVNHKTDDRELESLPFQSFIQTAKIHYDERPDIKKILSNCDGSSIGVLVSGPRKMRHEVASICTSCSTDNLHFESISFSW
ncbi:ferric-chelate reductase (NADH) [Trifolium repens]|nr:ferric-chelate reductase (NADH) [Trifolium repens]